jgi:DhnA family fructose-bisphosphate aldolase class Ia
VPDATVSEVTRSPAAGPSPAGSPAGVLDPALCRSYDEITELRSRDPGAIGRALAARRRRPSFLPPDGRLMLVAADHPARGALAAQGRPTAMHDRRDMLDRLQVALSRPGIDGLLATADVAEDLLLLGALEDKVVVASMNRGGLAGATFELDDRMTGYDVAGVVAARFDAAKMLNRIDLEDAGTVAMLETAGRAITELARAGVVAMLEPFLSRRVEGRVVNDLSADGVIKSVHIAQGLGATSAFTWLKLPVVAEMERVMDATTLPTLLLGGDPSGRPEETYASWRDALTLPAVRGLVVGRTLLYPPDDDVASAVDTAVSLVHHPGAS